MVVWKCEHVFITYVISFVILCVITAADLIDDRFRILYSKDMKCDHNRSLDLDVSDTQIYFYDFFNNANGSSPIDGAVEAILKTNELDYNRRLIIFVPGYKCNIRRNIEELIRQTFKDVPNTYLIIVDHSSYTYEEKEKIKSYLRSVRYSYYIGKAIGKVLSDFTSIGFQPENIHCIGHSLGSHIVSYAAEVYTNVTNNLLPRITGLDPAGPCFVDTPEEHIRSGVAKYVEVYHCNAGHLGTTKTVADADFFFNYEGKIQPNCDKGSDIEETAKCYHKACVRYWARTVYNAKLYEARSCTSYKAFAEGLCNNRESVIAGYHSSSDARGNYYITTDIL